MSARYRWSNVLVLAAVLAGVVGCSSAQTTQHYIVDDARIAADVQSRIATDPALNTGNIGVTSNDGVVYLTGTVPSADRLARATELAREVRGVRSVVNNMVVAGAPPRVAIVPAVPAPAPVVVPPSPAPAPVVVPPAHIVPGQQPLDVTGVVAQYDPQNGIVTFQDGLAVRMTADSRVAGPAGATMLQPGTRVTLVNVQAISYQPPGSGTWRIATVSQVDAPNGLIFLTDGTAVRVGPSTQLRSGTQIITLAQLRPGSQVAISVPPTAPPPSPTVYGSALPRQTTVVPLETPEVRIFVVPR
jgi:BON domain